MDMDRYEFQRFFINNETILYKIRHPHPMKRGKPVYYKAALEKDVLKEFNKKEIKNGVKKGFLLSTKIKIEGDTFRNVIAWRGQKMIPPGRKGRLILFFRKIKKLYQRWF